MPYDTYCHLVVLQLHLFQVLWLSRDVDMVGSTLYTCLNHWLTKKP